MQYKETEFKMTNWKATLSAVTALAGVSTLMLLGVSPGVRSAPAQKKVPGGWQTYKDPRLGFAVEQPGGWGVRADDHTILVQSPDHREIMFAEAFSASPGESAEAHLERLPESRASLFSSARLSGIAAQPSKGDEVAGTLTYQGGQGRVLCSVVKGKGLLFVLAASSGQFSEARPVLTHIVKSLRFMVPKSSAASAGKSAAAQMAEVMRSLHFVTWTDPREHGFHVSIPKGWKAEGGVFRFGPTDVRIAYQVTSSTKEMTVQIGDPRLPTTFVAPNAISEQTGMRDGTNGILHSMSALEFNRWYLNQVGRQSLDTLAVGAEHALPEVSRRQTAMAQQAAGGGVQVEASVGISEFSGRSKQNGKPVTGLIIGSTQRRTNTMGGMESTTWFGSPMVLVCTDDANKSRSQQTVMAVLTHLMQTYTEDPAWVKRRSQEIAQATGQALHRTAQRSQQIARDSDASRSALMGSYWGHVNADNERQRGFINYLGDRTDVTDGSGTSYNVQGGSKHYYQNGQTGTIVGTDSAYSPGVDFTPLTER